MVVFGSKNKILPGGILFGKLPDIYGRKTVLSYAMVALFVSSSLNAMSQEAWQFVMLRCCVGLSMGVTFPTCVVYGAEIVKSRYRELGPLVAALVWNFSVFAVSLSAYFLLNLIKWRLFIIFNTMPIIVCFILLQLVPESPRYLLVSRKYQEAKEALKTMAKWNDKKLPSNFKLQELEEEAIGSYSSVFSDHYRKDAIILSIAGFSDLFILFGIIVFLPLALYSDFCGGNLKPQPLNCVKVEQSSLKDLSIVTSSGIFASIVGLLSAVHIGRKLSWRISSVLGLISPAFLIKCISIKFTKIFLFLLKFSYIYHNTNTIILIPETFPTTIRSTAYSVCNFFAKLRGAAGCGLVYFLYYTNPSLVIGMFMIAAIVLLICVVVWDKETKDFKIADTSSDQLLQK